MTLPHGLTGLFEIMALAYVRVQGLRVENVGPWPENAGFLVENAQHVVLEGNVIDDTSSGIGVWGSADVTLDGNEVVRACHGGTQEQISVGGTVGFVVTNNRVHDPGGTANGGEGICLKDGSSGGLVHGNSVWSLPRAVGIYVDAWDKDTFDIEVSGNLVHDVATGNGIALASEMGGLLENIRVFNNVSRGNGWLGLLVAGYGGVPSHSMQDLLIVNNTIVGNGTAGWGGGISIDSQEIAGVDDYRLSAASPALDRGSAARAPSVDFDGIARPQGSGFDIGAFERLVGGGGRFYTLPPCRVLDTRSPVGPLGGPGVAALFPPFFCHRRELRPSRLRALALRERDRHEPHGARASDALPRRWRGADGLDHQLRLGTDAGKQRAGPAVIGRSRHGRDTERVGGDRDVILDVNGYFQ